MGGFNCRVQRPGVRQFQIQNDDVGTRYFLMERESWQRGPMSMIRDLASDSRALNVVG